MNKPSDCGCGKIAWSVILPLLESSGIIPNLTDRCIGAEHNRGSCDRVT